MAVAPNLPDHIRTVIGLEPLNNTSPSTSDLDEESNDVTVTNDQTADGDHFNGEKNANRRHSNESGNIKIGNDEVAFERGLNLSYM